MSTGFKHKPIIDPEWPDAFRAPDFWRPLAAHDPSGWTEDEYAVAADALRHGARWGAAAAAAGHTFEELAAKIGNGEFGVEAFIMKHGRENSSSHPATQAAVLASISDQHATGRREDREP